MVGCIRWVEDLNCNSEQHCFDGSMSESEDPYNCNPPFSRAAGDRAEGTNRNRGRIRSVKDRDVAV